MGKRKALAVGTVSVIALGTDLIMIGHAALRQLVSLGRCGHHSAYRAVVSAPTSRLVHSGGGTAETREHGGPKLSASANRAGILIIGDEILAGKVVDVNASWLSKLLNNRGIDVCRIETVGDCTEEIVDSVRRIKARVGDGPVFTSGGIGPTHDDVTYPAIAAALGREVRVHEATLARMKVHYESKGLEVNEMRLRMATLPEPDEVLFTEGMWVPLAVV